MDFRSEEFKNLPDNMQQIARCAQEMQEDNHPDTPTPNWNMFGFRRGDFIVAKNKDLSKVVMFVSKGTEAEDTETANMAGIINPRFGNADYWFSLYTEESFLVVRDAAGVGQESK